MAVAFDAAGPSSAGTNFTTSPGTWTHVNGGNGILVGVTTFTGSSNVVTGVTYGGVTVPFLGFVASGGDVAGGVALYGLVGGTCPTGSNTVSVSTSDSNSHNAGSVSVSGAGSLGTVVTNTAPPGSGGVSAAFGSTTSGGLIVSATCQGAGGTFVATSPNVLQLMKLTGAGSASDNIAIGTDPSTGSAVTAAWTMSPQTDEWGIVAVEVLPSGGAAAGMAAQARPGQTWLRRFHHRQQLLQPGIPPAAVAAVPAPVQRPSITSRPARRARLGPRGACAAGIAVALAASTAVPAGVTRPPVPVGRTAPSRARVGPQGRNGAGLASAIVTPRGTPARPQPFVFRSPLPGRARTGRAGLPAAGIASAIVTPLGSPPQPAWRQPIPRRVPDRAQVGPAGRNAAGIASQTVTPRGTPGPAWRPGARSPAPRRALWRAGTGPQPAAVTTVTAYQHAPPPPRSPAPRRALWRGYGSPVVTPRGTPTSRRPVFIAPGRRTRATIGHGQVAGGIAGPQAVAPIAPQAYQHPPLLPRSSAPRRALWRGLAVPAPRSTPGPLWRAQPRPGAGRRVLWRSGAGPQPAAAAAAPPRLPRQPRPAAPRRAVWHGLASRIVTPLGIPSRKPPPPANTPRKRQRGLWRRGAGPQPPPPSGLLAGVTAGPPASRWQAALPASRWTARPAASRWQAGQPAARYDAGNPAPRWAAGLPLQGRYSVRVVTGSVEYIPFPVSGPPGVDVTTLPLEVAIVTEAHGEPPPGDPAWTAGLWLNGMAAALVDETALGNGDYVVFGRLTATPEKPVVRAGRVRLGPAS